MNFSMKFTFSRGVSHFFDGILSLAYARDKIPSKKCLTPLEKVNVMLKSIIALRALNIRDINSYYVISEFFITHAHVMLKSFISLHNANNRDIIFTL